ncbi:hypothetical protein pEaSNUABM14_00005 [Erwinia phage pEa_SNUABM_14]|uniref:Uncharacterized protein n=1 Tax=Erwinia phage pEa_SNUABM_7 TaxID=2866695 RepID=A0AAE7WU83_9CAUD|nr:DNA ligase [Erwinia phage pEa_SNUABM_7]QYW02964.1 hypothetical protein pEaSNUABM13_00005 [Erwinia phage pEa_SNUABM_13]QYW03648.1 hypothetical protein pEaSNUABM45_00005 [Erwinia phage pEa_SNUABM_45]QYW03989.1 hypothetical protein pEaSNUABM46_00005 [Erwinia phage pEa_SNUABM_46]QYW04330.1 hypothetical protein pEaSNUABM14_00005 [Erwinia phage pEa_SNUABM_14]QYW05019.1 hypothetical protein pEaSNUABM21_00005 [Erwinia phage pEa_SNUABM_21]QYW05361.1 hypothetical protein pEaSNUABM25_00005 [Erwinia p
MENKFYNPLTAAETVKSQSSTDKAESTSGAFQVENPNVCPKCASSTVPTQLLDGEQVMFCTSCRVSLAIPLK